MSRFAFFQQLLNISVLFTSLFVCLVKFYNLVSTTSDNRHTERVLYSHKDAGRVLSWPSKLNHCHLLIDTPKTCGMGQFKITWFMSLPVCPTWLKHWNIKMLCADSGPRCMWKQQRIASSKKLIKRPTPARWFQSSWDRLNRRWVSSHGKLGKDYSKFQGICISGYSN